MQRQSPPLERAAIDEMREALHVAVDGRGGYLALPEAVRHRCLAMCLALDERGDSRLVGILDAADRVARIEVRDLDVDVDLDDESGPGRRR
ncbi:MAG: hypothetical protein ACREF1_16135 [Acetobacteraceae bacterium]